MATKQENLPQNKTYVVTFKDKENFDRLFLALESRGIELRIHFYPEDYTNFKLRKDGSRYVISSYARGNYSTTVTCDYSDIGFLTKMSVATNDPEVIKLLKEIGKVENGGLIPKKTK